MVVELFGDQMANLVPLVWTQVWSVAVMVFFVALVRFLMRKKMMNLMNPKKHVLEFHVRVFLRLVPL